jgi:hypothetical protein
MGFLTPVGVRFLGGLVWAGVLLCFLILDALLLSGCSALDNSERYYKNRPYQPINYRTYQTD